MILFSNFINIPRYTKKARFLLSTIQRITHLCTGGGSLLLFLPSGGMVLNYLILGEGWYRK